MLDCGANVGSFARMAAPVLGPRGTVYCLEPIPDVCVALQLNIAIYQKWANHNGLKVAQVVPIQAGAHWVKEEGETGTSTCASCVIIDWNSSWGIAPPCSSTPPLKTPHDHGSVWWLAVTCTHTAGIAADGSLPEREFAYYPRLTAMSTMYPDETDAAQVWGCCCYADKAQQGHRAAP